MSISIVRTSKGPFNVNAFCRASVKTDQGQSVGISFHTMDGGSITLPLPEGDRLIQWINERSLFDSTVSAPAAKLDTAAMWEYQRGSGGE